MLPLDKSQIPALYRQAQTLERTGKTTEAVAVYKSILSLDNKLAPVHFQLGQIAYRKQDLSAAAAHLNAALAISPNEPALWQALAKVTADMDSPTTAQAFLKKAKKARLDRKLLLALQNQLQPPKAKTTTALGRASPEDVKRAIDFLQSGRHDKAAKLASKLRIENPDVAIIADILANAQAGIGELEAAEVNFRAALQLDPEYAETRVNFGRFLTERGRFDEAIEQLRAALKLAPKMVRAMVAIGVALKHKKDNMKAVAAFRQALKNDPNNVEAHSELGHLLVNESEPDQALAHLEEAARLGADPTENRISKARALLELGQEAETLDTLAHAQKDAPNNPEVLFTLALTHQRIGQFDDARAAFREAIALEPRAGRFYRAFLASEKLGADDPLFPQMEQAFYDETLARDSRINFGFALAKAMEDTKQYHRVFEFLKPANDWMREEYPFDFNSLNEQSQALMDVMRSVDFANLVIQGRSDYAPIFVTGLPRSGTTLVEQIISSHSKVTGGGELGFARRAWGEALIDTEGNVRNWTDITPETVAEIGQSVAEQMRERFKRADHVTDKSVLTYSMIGPIRASLPKAKFVIVKRDPRDNLLSMYKNIFAGGTHLHSYSLTDSARYFHLFDDFVSFWTEKAPNWFHVIQYENLIANPEEETRKLIAACDLEWEDQCLSFHENKRRVDTLSVHQVRQPLYASSTEAWRRYQADLAELFDALGPKYMPENQG